MSALPTVKIKRPDNDRGGFAIINESDFDPAKHELFDAPPSEDVQPEAGVDLEAETSFAKGPRGLWYAMQDGKRVSSGYATEAEARAAFAPAS